MERNCRRWPNQSDQLRKAVEDAAIGEDAARAAALNPKMQGRNLEGELRVKRRAVDRRCQAWARIPIRSPIEEGGKT